ncbi:hypothetical protein F5141DRAFT_1064743 [Pisolithus sp. B1]|nr:hypothetical protein F5141DRAFT_1064743 [Pisolithus sp. B1]
MVDLSHHSSDSAKVRVTPPPKGLRKHSPSNVLAGSRVSVFVAKKIVQLYEREVGYITMPQHSDISENNSDVVICEEWTYPSAIVSMVPWNFKLVPVVIDGQEVTLRELLPSRTGVSAKSQVPGLQRVRTSADEYAIITLRCQCLQLQALRGSEKYTEFCLKCDATIIEDDPFTSASTFANFAQLGDKQTFTSGSSPSFLKRSHTPVTRFH